MKAKSSVRLWSRYRRMKSVSQTVGITVDPSRMNMEKSQLLAYQSKMDEAFKEMDDLEAGKVANKDENRMVGHYWLRAPELAPNSELSLTIKKTVKDVKEFARKVHSKEIAPPRTRRFSELLVIGIGGSALGPQLAHDCLGYKTDRLNVHYIDNTDPDGISRVLYTIGGRLRSTLVVVISKSGGTQETRNGLNEIAHAFKQEDLDFPRHAVAITGEGSKLEQRAKNENWLAVFPMWDWVGGRTSITSAVGLLPMALQGIKIEDFLKGAKAMDEITRKSRDVIKNPAANLAVCWHYATGGKGERDMVILPYKDRLLLLSRYLQQLVMESLGKEKDRSGRIVNQGIAVYGNKGSTDQHAYVQQLRDGVNNFFVNFLIVEKDTRRPIGEPLIDVDPENAPYASSGDYLYGFWLGTRQALYEKDRPSVTIKLNKLDNRTLGAVIALYERAVGYYASLININAYHQPGVEAGKQAAKDVLALQTKAIDFLKANEGERFSIDHIAEHLDAKDQIETLYHVLEHQVANKRYVQQSRRWYKYLEPKGD